MERDKMHSSGIFYDSANLADFKKWYDTHIISGATTNPLILQKENILNVPEHIDKMIQICGNNFPISVEIPDSQMDQSDMIALALKYKEKFPGNAVIKVPMDPRDPAKAFEVMYKLGLEGVRVNATLGLSMGQLVGASEALRGSKAEGDNYVSLFWARRDEAKKQIVDQMVKNGTSVEEAQAQVPDAAATLAMTLKYLETHSLATKVIVGSVRNAQQIEQAFSVGADIVTIPPKLLNEWMYTERGVETVNQFDDAFHAVLDKVTLV